MFRAVGGLVFAAAIADGVAACAFEEGVACCFALWATHYVIISLLVSYRSRSSFQRISFLASFCFFCLPIAAGERESV